MSPNRFLKLLWTALLKKVSLPECPSPLFVEQHGIRIMSKEYACVARKSRVAVQHSRKLRITHLVNHVFSKLLLLR